MEESHSNSIQPQNLSKQQGGDRATGRSDIMEKWHMKRRMHGDVSYADVEHYVGEGEGGALATRLRAKVRLMVEKRELEEKIDTGEKQLGAMKIIETFEVIV